MPLDAVEAKLVLAAWEAELAAGLEAYGTFLLEELHGLEQLQVGGGHFF